ncbi:MAG TPA: hypothetical protein VHY08_15410 [Bacillota bacterium]|nr:hypothetical protein [Bacillota bacterium]
MKTNIQRALFIGICLFVLTLMSSCSNTSKHPKKTASTQPTMTEPALTPTPTTANPTVELTPPSQVTVARENGGLRVSWSESTGAEAYQVLRKDGDCDFTGITGEGVSGTSWTDMDYPKNKVIQYKVVSLGANQTASQPSAASTPISDQVLDLKASLLAYSDQVTLTWSVHPEGPDLYKIRRSTSQADLNGQVVGETAGNSFCDTSGVSNYPPTQDTPYYYRVTWVKDGIEYGKEVRRVLGMCSSKVDSFEPNNVSAQAALLIKGLTSTAYTYAFDESLGEGAVDPDWYWYQKSGAAQEALRAEIKYPEGSLFLGKLRFQAFDINGYKREGQLLVNEDNVCICLLEESDTGLYLRIEPDGTIGNEGIGAYTITLK